MRCPTYSTLPYPDSSLRGHPSLAPRDFQHKCGDEEKPWPPAKSREHSYNTKQDAIGLIVHLTPGSMTAALSRESPRSSERRDGLDKPQEARFSGRPVRLS